MQMYLVGGAVRDELLGVPSKDQDFSVVLTGNENGWHTMGGNDPFKVMAHTLEEMGFDIFLETPEFLTVRARFPGLTKGTTDANPNGRFGGKAYNRLTADFVLARKESDYKDGRRPDVVEVGTLLDDLSRRDFRMNAIAKAEDGTLIDPFNGQADIKEGIIRAVSNPVDRLREDALRAVRALRFAVTKTFFIDCDLAVAMEDRSVLHSIRNSISDERIQQELSKMFRFNTVRSINILTDFPELNKAIFSGAVSLDATMKQKGRG